MRAGSGCTATAVNRRDRLVIEVTRAIVRERSWNAPAARRSDQERCVGRRDLQTCGATHMR
jgi:hypothetical protein